MSDNAKMDDAARLTSDQPAVSLLIQPTELAAARGLEDVRTPLTDFAGRQTITRFAAVEAELNALINNCGVFDLGWRALIAVKGEDRLRWLSGMTTNAVQHLPENEGNYSFFLNAQGRIQGDAFVYRDAGRLLLDTTADQVEKLMAHLDRFIIMDDVELEDLGKGSSALSVAGPKAARLLAEIGMLAPAESDSGPIRFQKCQWKESEILAVATHGVLAPQFALFGAAEVIDRLWKQLIACGAQPCGVGAVEALRILEGLPRYGIDVNDRDLPQETSQSRALNFNKGCYLGQEIVERIRSRGAVHRALMQFSLDGEFPALPAELMVSGKSVGMLTSAVALTTLAGRCSYALGIVRSEAVNKGERLTYNGGEANVLQHPPAIAFP